MLLIVNLVGMSHVVILFSRNIILLMILFVVCSIFLFVRYYIRRDVSSENFKLLKVLFLMLMIFILSSFGIVIFIG